MPGSRPSEAMRHSLLKEWSTAVSGALILGALGAGALAEAGSVREWLMVAAALVAGADVAGRAIRGLRDRHVSIELLVTLAAGGALVIGEYWEAAAVTFLFQLGAYLEKRTMRSTRAALGDLLDVAPERALVVRDGETVEVSPGEVAVGEVVVVKPGSRVPVDGEVLSGAAAVDESMITGEPMPADKGEGSQVFAGTVAQAGLLRVRATAVGTATTLARVIQRVEEAQEAKAPAQRFMERFARWYTPGIIGLASVTLIVTADLELALTLLVIGCPGALVISTPVSIVAGIGRAARSGILIKGGQHLEDAGRIDVMALDKTGTLTEGRPRLVNAVLLSDQAERVMAGAPAVSGGRSVQEDLRSEPPLAFDATVSFGDEGISEHSGSDGRAWLIRLAATAEVGSDHPLAKPVVAAARAMGPVPSPDTMRDYPGQGITATSDAREIAVGNTALMRSLEISLPTEAKTRMEEERSRGRTVSVVAVDGRVAGLLVFADTLRPEASEAVRRLRQAGVNRVVMLTGDSAPAVAAIARAAGIDEVHAELLPEDKQTRVAELRRDGRVVAMVGDGINDAPALATADVSVAMGAAGTDVALETADIALMADDLLKLPEAVRLSRLTRSNILQNVAVALLTVTALLAGVLVGEVHMAGGMLIHEASVLLVIGNAMRLLKA